MSEDASARLALPLLAAGQAQKEMTHNEALAMLDLAVQASVVAVGVDAVPDGPAIGACWVVGPAPAGDWAGQAHAIAGWTPGGWRFVAPREGLSVWCADSGEVARFVGGAWVMGDLTGARLMIDGVQVVGARAAAIAGPSGGTTIDGERRAAIARILDCLRTHGMIEV